MSAVQATILFPNDQKTHIKVKSNLTGADLFSLAAGQFVGLKEKDYFGLKWHRDDPKFDMWISMEPKVLDQLPAKAKADKAVTLTFCARYHIEDITLIKDLVSQKLFFLDAKQKVANGDLSCPAPLAIKLCALALQALEGDFLDESATKHHIRELLPLATIVENNYDYDRCGNLVSEEYRKLSGTNQAGAMLSYMKIVQQLPRYGVHYYSVSEDGTDALLGISPRGMALYEPEDLVKPRRSWTWSQLVNISWRKKKFELELLEQQVVSPDKPYPSNRASDVADFEETTEVALLTEHQTYPDQMLKMVQFQHQHSIDVLKLQRKQRRIECTPPVKGRAFRDSGAGSELCGAHNPPGEQKNASQTLGGGSNAPVRLFQNPGNGTEVTDSEDVIDQLMRRRVQLCSELERKRKLLVQYEEQEREFLGTDAEPEPDGAAGTPAEGGEKEDASEA